jgi:hypothetical protein
MIALNKFNCYNLNLGQKKHDFDNDAFKVVLLSAHADPTDLVLADLSELGTGGGYTAGGIPLNVLDWSETGGNAVLLTNNPSLTTSGTVGPIWAIAVINDTTSGKPVMFYSNFATGVTLPSGITWPVGIDTDNGIWSLS